MTRSDRPARARLELRAGVQRSLGRARPPRLASAVAFALDRPGRARRSGEALLAILGAGGCAAAALAFPGLAGHPRRRARSAMLPSTGLSGGGVDLDRGLLGLLVLAAAPSPAAASRRSPRRPALLARGHRQRGALLATGIVASIVHLPTLASLWSTNYGLALIAKSILLACALVLGAFNNLARARGSSPRQRRDQALGEGAARLLRGLVLGETALLSGAVSAAAILTSIAPPSNALARGNADPHVRPGPSLTPSRAATCASSSASSRTAPRSTTPSRFACSVPASPCATRSWPRTARHARHGPATARRPALTENVAGR